MCVENHCLCHYTCSVAEKQGNVLSPHSVAFRKEPVSVLPVGPQNVWHVLGTFTSHALSCLAQVSYFPKELH